MGYGATFGILGGHGPLAPLPLNPPMIFNDLERPLPPVSRSRHFWRWISQKGSDIQHSFDGILIGITHALLNSVVTLSHLAKYSMTRSVARSLCDIWASCMLRSTFYGCTYDAHWF